MSDFDPESFAERAAIMEYDGGLSRFDAETRAAKAQGLTRWQAMEAVRNAERMGNPQQARDHGQANVGHMPDAMPGVQHATAQQAGPMPVGDIQAGRDRLELLALRGARG